MKLLVTGCCGFIGSNFVRRILKKHPDWQITNLDKLTYAGNPDNLKGAEGNYMFIKGDICDEKAVEEAIQGADAVINFAAESHVDRSIGNANPFVTTNIYGTYVLLEAARRKGVKKFIQISTDEVYGSIKEGSFKENDRLEPSSPYSSSKASADLLALSYHKTYQLPIVVCRSTNNFGPYQNPEKLIPLFVTNALENKELPVYGTGQNVRDWIFVEDNCSAIELVLQKGKEGEIYNIGSGNEKTNIEITRLILKQLGKSESLIKHVADRLGHDFRYSLDNAKVRQLGWKPEHTFGESMKQTIEWYKNNRNWWGNLKV